MSVYSLYCKTNDYYIRASDIAANLNVTRPSVTRAIRRLQTLRLIIKKPRLGISLTNQGYKKAEVIRLRYEIIRTFLEKSLMLAPKAAGKEAWQIEHMVSNEIIYKMSCFNHKDMPVFTVKDFGK